MEDYSNQNGHSGYDPKYNPQSYGPNYDYGSYGNDPYGEGGPNKSVKGLKIMIVIMALILAALSAIYFLQVKQMKDDFAIERDTLTRQLTSLMNDYDTLKTMNDTLAVHYEGVKHQADSLLDKLQKDRRLSYSKIRNYEKQMSYMRTVMEGYIRQIDSLDRINKKLVNENTTIRKMITTYKLRAETAEERPMFRDGVAARRCVVPATGFYEWDADKRRYLFRMPARTELYMAALYGVFGGEARYCILTTQANASVAPVHHRMPLVLRAQEVRPWLEDEQTARRLLHETPPELERRETDGQLRLW